MNNLSSKLKIAEREFESRLLVCTGKFASNFLMRDALEASGTQIVTVALRRADLSGGHDPFADILDYIDPNRYLLLPNTSGAMTAEEAIRLARLAASAGLPKWVKLEIHPDPHYLLPESISVITEYERRHDSGRSDPPGPTGCLRRSAKMGEARNSPGSTLPAPRIDICYYRIRAAP